MATQVNYGFVDSEFKPSVGYVFTIDEIQNSGWILILFLLIYIWYSLV